MPHDMLTTPAAETLAPIERKLLAGKRLSLDDGLALYHCADPFRLGQLAQQATFDRVGRRVYYALNRHINYSNVCRLRCAFCTFRRTADAPDAYTLSPDEIARIAQDAQQAGVTEVHIVGGVHPDLPFEYYHDVISHIRLSCKDLHIKAFTAVEIIDLAEKAGLSIEKTLASLIEAGLGALPGGGAEILCDEYFTQFCPAKPGPDQWLDVHETAHRLGLNTNATMLFGYGETIEQRLAHLLRLRDLQDQSLASSQVGHFDCFVPLPYVPPGKGLQNKDLKQASGSAVDQLKTIAISRLLLDNFDHVKAFWPMLGIKIAQIALTFGADDLDGTVEDYRVVEKNDQNLPTALSRQAIAQVISETGRTPTQRDGFYRPVSGP